MNESHDELEGGTRRQFLRGAGAAAGGAVLIGAGSPAEAQEAGANQPHTEARTGSCVGPARDEPE